MNVQPHLLELSAYINQNLEKDLPLSSLAKRVGLSPFHFHRKFGAYFGESLHQHIKRLRLERAAFSLTTGSKPVREIARESGYKTVSAFSHAFSGFAGQSPTRYRTHMGVDAPEGDAAPPVRPAWVGSLASQPMLFLRATARGRGAQDEVGQVIDLVAHALSHRDDAAAAHDTVDLIVATTDLYGIARAGAFRVDVGTDEAAMPPQSAASFGRQALPAGRYARFDLRCRADDLIEQAYGAFRQGLAGLREAPRVAPCFVRFTIPAVDPTPPGSEPSELDYRLFVPLEG